ncbi:hypothetical protein [Altericroceibacterium endophyticum]|uniref:hypothetical protein n=1 Tax=Altericroceibacterium endophyticum TaxID=1808508 RepID=UPI001371A3AB|nr:hypothetical protein [Altericroceibacterium endophyticum]
MAMLPCILLAACTPTTEPDQRPASPAAGPTSDMSSEERATCEANGGFVDRRGRLQAELCIHPFVDAGQTCRDSSECEGKCIATGTPQENGETKGQCQKDDALFGCYSEVEDGQSVRAICVD